LVLIDYAGHLRRAGSAVEISKEAVGSRIPLQWSLFGYDILRGFPRRVSQVKSTSASLGHALSDTLKRSRAPTRTPERWSRVLGLLQKWPSTSGNIFQGKDWSGGIWVGLPPAALSSHDGKSVYFDKATGGFFLNPIAFFDLITDLILKDFVTYAGRSTNYQLPAVYSSSTVEPGTVPNGNSRKHNILCTTSGSFEAN
jgi:hypothetical protein